MQLGFYAAFRDLTGEADLRWSEPTTTLADLLNALAKRYGEEFRNRVLEGEDLARGVVVLINGRDARRLGGTGAALSPDDSVLFLPVAGGGCEGDGHGRHAPSTSKTSPVDCPTQLCRPRPRASRATAKW